MTTEYQVGEFKVKVREASLGPLVRGYAKRDANGQRHLLDLPLEPEALPPPATGRQVAILNVGIQHAVLSEHVLPEMSRRVGRSVDLDTFYASPHWQKWLQKAQVLFHGGRGYDVRLNDEVVLPPPPDGHVTLIREHATWSGQSVRLSGTGCQLSSRLYGTSHAGRCRSWRARSWRERRPPRRSWSTPGSP